MFVKSSGLFTSPCLYIFRIPVDSLADCLLVNLYINLVMISSQQLIKR